ncbi:MAG: gamma-glutamyl-gamma-aminobutyrate hydrolase family protein [Myxococcales bacterium]|nr:gamma-glutamyl-gamma-aminobutyrate hydrolase family protein [Myxococcales bacterium]MCB9646295.1 gamma-glutamyl-gamma-aminobutyrate hydrolase family protein [Deltaproteobacteria bacterium]
MSRPNILITVDTGAEDRRGVSFENVHLKRAYVDAVEKAGGVPLLVAPTDDPELIGHLIQLMCGLVVTGGAFDIPPDRYGHEHRALRRDATKPRRTEFEARLIEGALARARPVLGICGGMQLLNVVLGGTLLQDIAEAHPDALPHEQASSPAKPDHSVLVVRDTPLEAMAGRTELQVNSTHHQAVDTLGRDLEVWGRAPDGIIEAIGMVGAPEICGVQWHPELLGDAVSDALYSHLVARSCR